jgi:hypothetical protein
LIFKAATASAKARVMPHEFPEAAMPLLSTQLPSATESESPRNHADNRPGRRRRIISSRGMFLAAIVISALVAGLLLQDRLRLDPGHGTGYWLGIAGTALMIALLGYPLRKRAGPVLPGSVSFWFRLHMTFGLLGPLLVLYHSNFRWSALNSGLALWATLLVAFSGLVGRYIHVHIYSRYSLQRREADKLIGELRRQHDRLDNDGDLGKAIEERLEIFREIALRPRTSLSRGIYTSLKLWFYVKRERRKLVDRAVREVSLHFDERNISEEYRPAAVKAVRRDLNDYLDMLVDVGTFSTFERLFAIWHQAHAPLYIFLGFAVIIHVLAVHYY